MRRPDIAMKISILLVTLGLTALAAPASAIDFTPRIAD